MVAFALVYINDCFCHPCLLLRSDSQELDVVVIESHILFFFVVERDEMVLIINHDICTT